MATTTGDETTGRTHVGEAAREALESLRVAVTGSPFVSLRSVLLLMVAAAFVTLGDQPFAALGAASMVWIAYDFGRKK